MSKAQTRQFLPEKVAPKLQRYALAKEWEAIIAEEHDDSSLREKLIAEFDRIYWDTARKGRLVDEMADVVLALLEKAK